MLGTDRHHVAQLVTDSVILVASQVICQLSLHRFHLPLLLAGRAGSCTLHSHVERGACADWFWSVHLVASVDIQVCGVLHF